MKRPSRKKINVSRSSASKKKSANPAARLRAKFRDKKIIPPPFWPAAQTQPQTVSAQEVEVLKDLPFSYNETKLVLMVRDPYWAYSYWDFAGDTWSWTEKKLSEDSSLKPILRIQNLDQKSHYDLLVSLETKNWYIHLGVPDNRYVAELGIGDGRSRFYLIARSNEVRTPRDTPSEEIDSEWSDRDFDEIYRLSGGGKPGLSSPGSLFFKRPL